MNKKQKPTKVRSVDHLKELIAQGRTEYFMVLERAVKSQKTIHYDTDTRMFSIIHHIDGVRQQLSADDFLMTRMRDAIQVGAFFAE